MRYAHITNGTVDFVCENNPFNLFSPAYANEFVIAPDDVQHGWIVDGETVVAPPVVVTVPQQVSMRQARLALNQAGLLNNVEVAVASASKAVQIEWEFASDLQRTWPTLIALQASLGLTDQQVDDLFTLAATL